MADRRGAARLIERVAFDQRSLVDDGYGNQVADWVEQFQQPAEFVHLRGSETVIAGRLESRQAMIMRIRVCTETRSITADWQVRDVRRGLAYNIRTITNAVDRANLDLLVEARVATG